MSNEVEGYPASSDLVLVSIIPSPHDLEIARVLGWYRIPLRYAPKIVHVDFLAFYQPGSFGINNRWQIRHIAAVRGVELTTRGELLRDEPDHPRAHEEYFKLQIGPLIALPQSIKAGKWKRITFIYTMGDLLLRAKTMSDLVVRNAQREILWRTIRERAHKQGEYSTETQIEDPDILKYLSELQLLAEESEWYQTI